MSEETTYDLNWQIAMELGWTELVFDDDWDMNWWTGTPPGTLDREIPLPCWDSGLNYAMPLYAEFLKATGKKSIETKNWLDKAPEQIAHDMALTWLMWKKARAVVYGG